jgi:plastocyanin
MTITSPPLFPLGIKVIGLTAIAAALLFSGNIAVATAQLAMIGQQYFADGMGIAYFNDGTTQEFEHRITEAGGYYFDESTPFYIGAVPGVGNNTDSVECSEINPATGAIQTTTPNADNSTFSSGNTTTVTIIRGASILEDKSRAVDPSPIVTINVNDTVQWINQDTQVYLLISPPPTIRSDIEEGTIISTNVYENGGAHACTFSEPGGYHYTMRPPGTASSEHIRGAVIVTEGDTPTTSTEQEEQEPSSPSPFSPVL